MSQGIPAGAHVQACIISLLATILVSSIAVGPARGQSWRNLPDYQFPARVRSVVFSNGAAINENSTAHLGQWGVSFGTNVRAIYDARSVTEKTQLRYITIKGLKCTNPVGRHYALFACFELEPHRSRRSALVGELFSEIRRCKLEGPQSDVP